MCAFQTRSPTSGHFRLSTLVDFQDKFGVAGLAFGIHQTSERPLKYHFWIVYVRHNYPEPGTWLWVEECESGMNEVQHLDVRARRMIKKLQVNNQSHRSHSLELEVSNQRVVQLTYLDQPVPELVAALATLHIPPQTGCGIVALSHVVFHSTTCEDLPR
jgi:hypothetical protein